MLFSSLFDSSANDFLVDRFTFTEEVYYLYVG